MMLLLSFLKTFFMFFALMQKNQKIKFRRMLRRRDRPVHLLHLLLSKQIKHSFLEKKVEDSAA